MFQKMFALQKDEKNQIMTTNVWLRHVSRIKREREFEIHQLGVSEFYKT